MSQSSLNQFPLKERIGHPDLYVYRNKQWNDFLEWTHKMPKMVSKSRAILARKKSGKTAFIQRLFNHLWQENGPVVPFYFEVSERRQWLEELALSYYEAFASQYISFITRDPAMIRKNWRLPQIQKFAEQTQHSMILQDLETIQSIRQDQTEGRLWDFVCSVPEAYAASFDIRVLVMIDEFQYLGDRIYLLQSKKDVPDPSIPGVFHGLSESKIAPMLVTGSYIGWLLNIMRQHLEGARLKIIEFPPSLAPEESLEVVLRLSEHLEVPVTNTTALQIAEMCQHDPFFIRCLMDSAASHLDLTTEAGVREAVKYEVTSSTSEMARTWGEYIYMAVDRINQVNAKRILFFLTKYRDRVWTHREIQKSLKSELDLTTILHECDSLWKADLILRGHNDITFQGLQDSTLEMILTHRFQGEIEDFQVDWDHRLDSDWQRWKQRFHSAQGRYNWLSGRVAEYLLANELRHQHPIQLSQYFHGISHEEPIVFSEVQTRYRFQIYKGVSAQDFEIDVKAEASTEQKILLVEVKKIQTKVSESMVATFAQKVRLFVEQNLEKQVLAAIWGWSGFTEEALQRCRKNHIGYAESADVVGETKLFKLVV